MSIAQQIIAEQKDIEARRGTFEQHWTEVARYVLQRQDDFYGTRTPGEKRTEYLFDSVAPMALEKCASAVESIVTPRTTKWHSLKSMNRKYEKNLKVRAYYEDIRDQLFNIRYSGDSGFSGQWFETLVSTLAFGTGVMIIEDQPGKGITYKSSHLSEHFLIENAYGGIDTNYRKFKFTGAQATQYYGDDLPEKIREKCAKNPNDKHEFINLVKPNDNYERGSFDKMKLKFISYHVCVESGEVIRTSGYRTFPFIIARYFTAPGEVYGRSPAMMALPEIKMVNKMRKSDLRARNRAVDPPILTAHEGSLRKVNMKEGAINFGALDANGNPLMRPWEGGARIDLSNDSIEQSHQIINDAFLITLFQILVQTPEMTATEALQRAQEKSALLAPTMGRIQSEAISQMILRELDLLSAADALPEPPPELMGEDLLYDVEYTAPINRMQKGEEALAVQRTVEATIPIAQLDPSVMRRFNWNEYVQIIGEANGTPARLFYTDEQMKVIEQQAAQQQQAAMMAQAAPQLAGAVKDIAQAQSYGG